MTKTRRSFCRHRLGRRRRFVCLALASLLLGGLCSIGAAQAYEPPAAVLEQLKLKTGFSGVAIVDVNDGSPFVYLAGSAGKDRPVTVNTRFDIGSIGKMMTAVAVMQLAEAGKIDLDEPIGSYIDGLPNHAAAQSVAAVLKHQAGFGDFMQVEADRDRLKDAQNNHDYFEIVRRHALTVPGVFAYSNTGFVILGELIERVSGQPYETYLSERVLRPAGVVSALFGQADQIELPDVALGYLSLSSNGPFVVEAAPKTGWMTSAAGGLYLSAPNLVAFGRALLDYRLVSAEGLRRLCPKPHQETIERGLGCIVMPDGGIGHNGQRPGMQAVMLASRDTGAVVVALSNHQGQAEPVFWPLWRAVQN